MKKIITYTFLLILAANSTAQNRIFVLSTAAGQNNGSSWENAFTDLQTAIGVSAASDEIWVAQGIYKPTAGVDRTATFQPKSGTKIYGGFSGTETQLAQRNRLLHPVVLSGDIGTPEDSTDNCFNVMVLTAPDSMTVIDGFTFERGMAYPGVSSPASRTRQYCGGGLYVTGQDATAYPVISNCTFQNNYARNCGGGVMIYGNTINSSVSPLFRNCIFRQNNVFTYGGGVARIGGSAIERGNEFYRCDFIENRAKEGGGLYIEDIRGLDTIDVKGCNFIKNKSSINGGGISFSTSRNGGLWIKIDSCSINENMSVTAAGIDVDLNELSFKKRYVSINNSQMLYNTNLSGGEYTLNINMLGDSSSTITFNNNIIKDLQQNNEVILFNNGYGDLNCIHNKTEGYSILMRVGDMKRAIFKGNYFIQLNTTPAPVILAIAKSAEIKNCIFVSNSTTFINGVALVKSGSGKHNNNLFKSAVPVRPITLGNSDSTNYIYNSIIDIPYAESAFLSSEKYHFTNCSLSGSWNAIPSNEITYGGNNLFAADPLFINPDSNYHLQPCSPLINAGINSVIQPGDTDLDGNPRIRGSAVDIGPYESAPLSLPAPPQVQASCVQSGNGSATIATINACEPVQYDWSGPDGASGTILNELAPGAYNITVTDAKHDTLLLDLIIPQNPAPQLTAVTTTVFCGTTLGGSATLSGSNSTGPYQFDWGAGIADSIRSGLMYGTYPVTITDAAGCSSVATIQIGRMGNLQIQIDKIPVACHDNTDGSIIIQPVNGAAPYQWFWEYNGSTEPGITGLAPGAYSGTLTDALGCAVDWIVPLENPDIITLPFDMTPASGPAINDGDVVLHAAGGTGVFSAVWDNGATGLELNGVLPGFYTATVTDEHDCIQTITVEVTWSTGTSAVQASFFKIWPNPAYDRLFIQPPSDIEEFTFSLLDAHGSLLNTVRRMDPNNFSVWVGDLPDGVYGWRMTTDRKNAGGIWVKE